MAKSERIRAPRGMPDVLPEEMPVIRRVEETARRVFERYGYEEIRTPLFEETRLFERNVFRIFDCKQKGCIEIRRDMPPMRDYLDEECGAHFEKVRSLLDGVGQAYEIDDRLVRGFDYYTRTRSSELATRLRGQEKEWSA